MQGGGFVEKGMFMARLDGGWVWVGSFPMGWLVERLRSQRIRGLVFKGVWQGQARGHRWALLV